MLYCLIFLFISLNLSSFVSGTAENYGNLSIINISSTIYASVVNESADGFFIVKNIGQKCNINISCDDCNNLNVNFSDNNFQLDENESKKINFIFSGAVPGEYFPKIKAVCDKDNYASFDAEYYINENILVFDSVSLKNSVLKYGEVLEDIRPDEKVHVSVNLKNNGNFEINDIKLEFKVKNIDDYDSEDIDFNAVRFNLDAGEYKLIKDEFDFVVPFSVQDNKTYEIYISATGWDENYNKHNAVFKAGIHIKKHENSISVLKFEYSPNPVNCGEDVNYEIEVANTGSNTLENAAYALRQQDFVNVKEYFELSNNPDSVKYTYSSFGTFKIPKNTKPGKYKLYLTLFRERVKGVVKDVYMLNVKCDNYNEEPQSTDNSTTTTSTTTSTFLNKNFHKNNIEPKNNITSNIITKDINNKGIESIDDEKDVKIRIILAIFLTIIFLFLLGFAIILFRDSH